jgi:hypothetical protein
MSDEREEITYHKSHRNNRQGDRARPRMWGTIPSPGVAADVPVPVEVPTGPTEHIQGAAQLTGEQMREVLDGLWYVNIHTEEHPDGEIRGQVENSGM